MDSDSVSVIATTTATTTNKEDKDGEKKAVDDGKHDGDGDKNVEEAAEPKGKNFSDLSIFYNSKGELELSGLDDWSFSDSEVEDCSFNSNSNPTSTNVSTGTLYNFISPSLRNKKFGSDPDLKTLILNDPTLQCYIKKAESCVEINSKKKKVNNKGKVGSDKDNGNGKSIQPSTSTTSDTITKTTSEAECSSSKCNDLIIFSPPKLVDSSRATTIITKSKVSPNNSSKKSIKKSPSERKQKVKVIEVSDSTESCKNEPTPTVSPSNKTSTSLCLGTNAQLVLEENSLFKKFLMNGSKSISSRKLFEIENDADDLTLTETDQNGFDLKDLSKLEITEEPSRTRTESWITSTLTNTKPPIMTTCEYISPIKRPNENDDCSTYTSKSAASNSNVLQSPGKIIDLDELDRLWKDIYETRVKMDQDISLSEKNLEILQNQNQASNSISTCTDKENRISIYSKTQPQPSCSTKDKQLTHQDFDNMELGDLLMEANIEPSEFDEILSQIDIPSSIDEDLKDDLLCSSLADIQIDSLNKLSSITAASSKSKNSTKEYFTKYHQEKAKRQKYEDDIISLQKSNLELKEKLSTQENLINKKDSTILKVTRAFEQISKQWRVNDITSKNIAIQLQKEYVGQVAKVRAREERISQYEKELLTSVEISNNFKEKIEKLELEKEYSKEMNEKENNQLHQIIEQREIEIEELKRERDTTIRALRNSQEELDNEKSNNALLQASIASQNESISQIKDENSILKIENAALESVNQNLTIQMDNLKKDISALQENQEEEFKKKIQEEAKRLNGYFNEKLREILTNQTDKMLAAENAYLENQKKKMFELEIDWQKKLNKEQKRLQSDMHKMKEKYETNVNILLRENESKNQLISRISEQLRLFGSPQQHQVPDSTAMLLQLHDISTPEGSVKNLHLDSQETRNYLSNSRYNYNTSTPISFNMSSVELPKIDHLFPTGSVSASASDHRIASSSVDTMIASGNSCTSSTSSIKSDDSCRNFNKNKEFANVKNIPAVAYQESLIQIPLILQQPAHHSTTILPAVKEQQQFMMMKKELLLNKELRKENDGQFENGLDRCLKAIVKSYAEQFEFDESKGTQQQQQIDKKCINFNNNPPEKDSPSTTASNSKKLNKNIPDSDGSTSTSNQNQNYDSETETTSDDKNKNKVV